MFDIIMTTYNRKELLKKTLESVFDKTTKIPYRLFVLDDCSSDGTQEYLASLNHGMLSHVVLNKERKGVRYGFDALWAAVRECDEFHVKHPFMCYMQDDMEILEEGWLETLLDAYKELKEAHKIGFFSAYNCIEHPDVEIIKYRGRDIHLKASTGFPNVVAEKSFWESIGKVPRLNPDGRKIGFPNNGMGSNMDVWFTGCYSKSRFDKGAASKNCAFNQGKSVMVIPMMRHLGQYEGSTWDIRRGFQQKIGRAVAFFSNGIGNLVMMMPALQAMASLTKDGKVDVCIDDHWNDSRRSSVEEILDAWPVVGKIIRHPKDRINSDDYEHWMFSAHGVSNDMASIFLNNMKRIVPKPSWRQSRVHEADHYMEIARAQGYEGEVPDVQFPLAEGPILDIPRPIIGLCNGYFRTSHHYWDKKGWPHFVRLSETVRLYLGGSTVAVGRSGEMPEEAKFTADYLGKLSILETARVISQLDLLITTDTGLMHIANILGVPLIAMFGPTLTTKNAPGGERSWVLISGMGCAPCQDNSKFHNCKAPVCMQSIGVGDVMSLTKMILGG